MFSKEKFIDIVEKIRNSDIRINEAESALGFELSTSGVISDLYEIVYNLLGHLANFNSKEEENEFFDNLGKILFIRPFPEDEMEEFYNKYFGGNN